MSFFSKFEIINRDQLNPWIIKASGGRDIVSHKCHYPRDEPKWPCLASIIAESKVGSNNLKVSIVFCSRNEAKRLVYPETNRHRGKRIDIGNEYCRRGDHAFYFAEDLGTAANYIFSKANFATDSDIQNTECNRAFNHLRKEDKWPVLIFVAPSTVWLMAYFATLDVSTAKLIVHKGKKPNHRSSAKTSPWLCGFSTFMDLLISNPTTEPQEDGYGSGWRTME